MRIGAVGVGVEVGDGAAVGVGVGLLPVTEAVNVTPLPRRAGLSELDSVVATTAPVPAVTVTESIKLVLSLGSAPAKLAKCGIAAHRATGPATVEAGRTGSDSWHGVEYRACPVA